jgi:hypothetical protein
VRPEGLGQFKKHSALTTKLPPVIYEFLIKWITPRRLTICEPQREDKHCVPNKYSQFHQKRIKYAITESVV